MAPAASSPTLWPAACSPAGWAWPQVAAQGLGGRDGRGDQQWLGHRGVPYLVGTGRLPYRIKSHPASSDQAARRSATPGTSSQGERKPGVCAPWPGAAMTSTVTYRAL